MLAYNGRTIHKVNITAEAIFDARESLEIPEFDFRALRRECEEYITRMIELGRIPWWGYFHIEWLDDASGRWFEIFFYKGETIGDMVQYWDLAGICFFEHWHEEWEERGQIRAWLRTKIEDIPDEDDDFAIRARVMEIFRNTEKTIFENFLQEVLNEFNYPRDKAIATKMAFLQSVYFKSRRRKSTKTKG